MIDASRAARANEWSSSIQSEQPRDQQAVRMLSWPRTESRSITSMASPERQISSARKTILFLGPSRSQLAILLDPRLFWFFRPDRAVLLGAFARSFRVTADDLNLISCYGLTAVVHLEGDILDQECPDVVTEAICVERALVTRAVGEEKAAISQETF